MNFIFNTGKLKQKLPDILLFTTYALPLSNMLRSIAGSCYVEDVCLCILCNMTPNEHIYSLAYTFKTRPWPEMTDIINILLHP